MYEKITLPSKYNFDVIVDDDYTKMAVVNKTKLFFHSILHHPTPQTSILAPPGKLPLIHYTIISKSRYRAYIYIEILTYTHTLTHTDR